MDIEVTKEKFKKAKALVQDGAKVKDACIAAGLHYSTYYGYVKNSKPGTFKTRKPKSPKVMVQALPDPVSSDPGKLMLVLGTPAELAKLMDYLK